MLEHLIGTKYTATWTVNKEREASKKTDDFGASAFLGVVGGAASLLFAGPILATTIGTSVGVGLYNIVQAERRDIGRKELARRNTSNHTTRTVVYRD